MSDFKDVKGMSELVPDGMKVLARGYAEYAAEVVRGRAISEIDGLKPSQRRILYTTFLLLFPRDLW